MYNKVLMFLVTGIFVLGISKLSFAMMCGGHSQHPQIAQTESGEHKHTEHQATAESTSKEVVDVGNKICPVSGEKIKEEMKATYEYEGKIYNFCCPMCIDEFKKDPEKYIQKVEEELKARAKEENEITPAMHEGHQH